MLPIGPWSVTVDVQMQVQTRLVHLKALQQGTLNPQYSHEVYSAAQSSSPHLTSSGTHLYTLCSWFQPLCLYVITPELVQGLEPPEFLRSMAQ